MDDTGLLMDLRCVVERLLARHISWSQEWFPHQLVPWDRGRDIGADGTSEPPEIALTPPAQAALQLNLLTEDNLPYYFHCVHAALAQASPWDDWVRLWTAEEARHAVVIRDYLSVTRAVDLVWLERARMRHMATGWTDDFQTPAGALVYLSLQELATRIAHHNTGRLIGDAAGQVIMSRVAADENLHHLFYRDLVSAAIEGHPSAMVRALDAQVRRFQMPGIDVPEVRPLAITMARTGLYDYAVHYEQILVPLVLRHWKLESVGGLDAEAEQCRERCMAYLDRMKQVARRLGERAAERVGAPAGADRRRPLGDAE